VAALAVVERLAPAQAAWDPADRNIAKGVVRLSTQIVKALVGEPPAATGLRL